MKRLYELSADIVRVANKVEEGEDLDALLVELDEVNLEFDKKVEACIVYTQGL